MKVLFERDPIFHQDNEESQRRVQFDEVRDRALARKMYQHDVASRLGQAYRSGIAEGEASGEEKARLQIGRAMKAETIDIKIIMKITGLSEEELAGI